MTYKLDTMIEYGLDFSKYPKYFPFNGTDYKDKDQLHTHLRKALPYEVIITVRLGHPLFLLKTGTAEWCEEFLIGRWTGCYWHPSNPTFFFEYEKDLFAFTLHWL